MGIWTQGLLRFMRCEPTMRNRGDKMQLPFKGQIKITTLYGEKGNWACGWHTGVDLVALEDKRVYAIAPGKVEYVRDGGAYGKHVRVRHDNGIVSLYAHLASIEVKKWDEVTCNTVLGIEGSTGNSSGNHLHLEVHKGAYCYPTAGSSLKECKWLQNPCDVLGVKNKLGLVEKEEGEMTYYETLEDTPEWGKETVQKLMDKQYLQGTGGEKLHLSEDMLRTLVILDRAGQFGA